MLVPSLTKIVPKYIVSVDPVNIKDVSNGEESLQSASSVKLPSPKPNVGREKRTSSPRSWVTKKLSIRLFFIVILSTLFTTTEAGVCSNIDS